MAGEFCWLYQYLDSLSSKCSSSLQLVKPVRFVLPREGTSICVTSLLHDRCQVLLGFGKIDDIYQTCMENFKDPEAP